MVYRLACAHANMHVHLEMRLEICSFSGQVSSPHTSWVRAGCVTLRLSRRRRRFAVVCVAVCRQVLICCCDQRSYTGVAVIELYRLLVKLCYVYVCDVFDFVEVLW